MTTAAEASSPDAAEITRKKGERLHSELLRRLADITQERAAERMGVSASTVSRIKEELGKFAHLLAALDMQVAATNSVVVNKDDQRALKRMAFNWLKADLEEEGAL